MSSRCEEKKVFAVAEIAAHQMWGGYESSNTPKICQLRNYPCWS